MTLVAISAAIAALAFAAVAGAYANARWKVVASSSDSSEFFAYASTNATMIAPNALAIRAAGDVDNVSWTANCEFERDPGRAGLYVISVAASSKCTVYASATGEGKVTMQVLKK